MPDSEKGFDTDKTPLAHHHRSVERERVENTEKPPSITGRSMTRAFRPSAPRCFCRCSCAMRFRRNKGLHRHGAGSICAALVCWWFCGGTVDGVKTTSPWRNLRSPPRWTASLTVKGQGAEMNEASSAPAGGTIAGVPAFSLQIEGKERDKSCRKKLNSESYP